MVDFNFSDRMEGDVAFGNYRDSFNLDRLIEELIFINPFVVPIIKLSGEYYPDSNYVFYSTITPGFRTFALNKERAFYVFNRAKACIPCTIARHVYKIGKGIIIDPNGIPLIVLTVPSINYSKNDLRDITTIVNKDYFLETTTIKWIINQVIGTTTGDIIYTNNIKKYLSGNINLPEFKKLSDKKIFTEQFIEKLLDPSKKV